MPAGDRLIPELNRAAVRVRTSPPRRSACQRAEDDLRAIRRIIGRDGGVRIEQAADSRVARPLLTDTPHYTNAISKARR